jgi:bisphosphoglycerate-dependent phosphoglycerate mutase
LLVGSQFDDLEMLNIRICALARPLWEYAIKNEIEKGNTVLVVAHTNTLRGLMKHIDNIDGKVIRN